MSNLPRFHCPTALSLGDELELPAGTARHVQVRRMQPDDVITLFNGEGGEFKATILRMGRSDVAVRVGEKTDASRELNVHVNLWCGITANERMDWLVEKATELGAIRLLPIAAERSVLKLKGERSDKKLAHWQAVAVAASEQCGRNQVMAVTTPLTLPQALLETKSNQAFKARWILSLAEGAKTVGAAFAEALSSAQSLPLEITVLSGPEGGLSPSEEALALAAGFVPVTLGARVLRAETAPVAVLSVLGALT
jgi:16S rRNA (uracil1498-N3)-methyltransferase